MKSIHDAEPAETLALVASAKRGESGSLEALLENHRERLLERIRLMMGSRARRIAESADFAQIVMLDAAKDLPGFEPIGRGSFLRWITQIARNRIRDAVRRRREDSLGSFVLERACSLGAGPITNAQARERSERVVEALLELSADHRQVIELRQIDGLPFTQVAERMQRSENAVQLLFARAMVRLGQLLRREDES